MNHTLRRRRCRPAALLVLGFLLSGCNIVQGFQDAGDTLFPEEATHLNAPGLRVVRGGYRGLSVATGLELYLLTRSSDADASALYAMRYADPRPCSIPSVSRFVTTHDPGRSPVLIAYFEENVRRGTLRFADLDCKRYDLELTDAMPVGEAHRGFVVWAGTSLLAVDPTNGLREVLVEDVQEVIFDLFGARSAVLSQGRLRVFDSDWEDEGTFGTDVVSIARGGRSAIYEDAAGIHRLALSNTGESLVDTLVAARGCTLGMRDSVWATYRAPCDEGKLFAYDERTALSFELPFDADPRYVRLQPKVGTAGEDPTRDPFWFFYLREPSLETQLGTLIVRTPDGEEHAIGERATLQRFEVVERNAEVYGYAVTEVEGSLGRYVWWKPDGTTRVLAEKTVRDAFRLVVDFDGEKGNLAVTLGDRLFVVAEGVPWQGFEYRDPGGRFTALLHDFGAQSGRLSYIPTSLDALERLPLGSSFPKPELEPIANNVRLFRTALLGQVLPGVMYLADFDEEQGTGRLEYRNLELGFTAIVNHGVSDYLVGGDDVLYTVPFGDAAGIWIVPAK